MDNCGEGRLCAMKYFGTDGIRGKVDGPLMEASFVTKLASAAATYFAAKTDSNLKIVIGRDTRASGERLASNLEQGFTATGADVLHLGIVPTPAVALAVRELKVDLGVVITASHNPAADNGIKFFNSEGMKLELSDEEAIEALIDALPELGKKSASVSTTDFSETYIKFALSVLDEEALKGMRIALDLSNGATCKTTPEIIEKLGAEVFVMGVEPDGENINEGIGSEHPEKLRELCRQRGASLGIAHDGDGDRVIFIDENGEVVDGDQVLGILALAMKEKGRLRNNAMVATVQSNQGLTSALQRAGCEVLRTDVGDRNVVYCMRDKDLAFGGESSGHIILGDILATGDGLLAALSVLKVIKESGRSLASLKKDIPLFPSCSAGVSVKEKLPLETLAALQEQMARISEDLGSDGRILLRYSGTESKLRILVEAKTFEDCERHLEALKSAAAEGLELL